MKTFSINTLGCKVNQYESQQIRQTLEQFGLSQVHQPHMADIAVINTCCVTHIASAKCRQNIRKALRNTKGPVIVTGCLPIGQHNYCHHAPKCAACQHGMAVLRLSQVSFASAACTESPPPNAPSGSRRCPPGLGPAFRAIVRASFRMRW